jgi:acetyltransferase
MKHKHSYGPKTFTLKSNQKILVRPVKPEADLDKIVEFLSSLSATERNFLRYKVTDREICRERLRQLDDENHFRLIAECDGEMVGDATLDREPFAWTQHVAKMRGVITGRCQKKGIGTILFGELVQVAEDAHMERLVCEVMADQKGIIKVLEKIGFHHEATLAKFVKDQHGKKHDMLIMTNDLIAIWEHLAHELEVMDIKMPPY